MATTYTDRLRLALMGQGENNDTWGTILNTQIGLLEDAICGIQEVDMGTSVDVTLTTNDGTEDESRHAVLKLTGTPTANISLIIPPDEKVYIIDNQLGGSNVVTLGTGAGTTLTFTGTNQRRVMLYCDGTDVTKIVETFVKAEDAETLGDVTAQDLTMSGDLDVTGTTTLRNFLINPRSDTIQVISSGVIVPVTSTFMIAPESGLVDDLVTINKPVEGTLVNFRVGDGSHSITLKHGVGNIVTPSGQDIVLDDIAQEIVMRYDYRDNKYHVISQPQILASTADAQAGTNNSKLMVPSTTQDQILENLPVRVVAAGLFNPDGTAISSYNMSLTKNSVGDFTAVFDTPEPDENYIPYVGNGGRGSLELSSYLNRAGVSTDVAPTANQFRFTIINNGGNTLNDFVNPIYIVVYRIYV